MRKNKIIFFVVIEIVLLIIFIMLMQSTQAREEQAKSKLEQAVNKSYIEDKLDAQSLINNIEKEIKGASVKDKKTIQFPLQAVVDGYEFKIEEDGKVDSIEDIENTQSLKKETNDQKEIAKIVKYKNDTKTDKGITVTTTEDGLVTINGKSTDKLYIKISNNIQISNNIKDFENWRQEDGIVIKQGTKIEEKINIINNETSTGEINIALRTEKNEALGVLKVLENQMEYRAALNTNIIANYIYIEKGSNINNMKIKIEITEKESKHEEFQLQQDSKIDKGIECVIDDSGVIELNGKANNMLYIKISNGMDIIADGTITSKLAISEPILFDKGKNLYVNVNKIDGNIIKNNINQEFNVVVKYQNGEIATKCKMLDKINIQEIQLVQDATIVYLYISPELVFEHYKMKIQCNEF